MDWKGFFILMEEGGIGKWVRESPSMLAFPTILALHAFGMGLLAGLNAVMDFRIFGIARRVPISALENLVPVMRFGFWLNAVSGVLLLLSYPTKALTNWVFYLKFTLIALALVDTWLIRNHVIQKSGTDDTALSARGTLV